MENRCVCCGAIIPEGRQVCPVCIAKSDDGKQYDYYKDALTEEPTYQKRGDET